MGQEFKKIGARFDFRLRAPLMADMLFLTKLTRCWRGFADSIEEILAASLKKVSVHKLN